MKKISVSLKRYRKLCCQNSEESKTTWVTIDKKMGLQPHFAGYMY